MPIPRLLAAVTGLGLLAGSPDYPITPVPCSAVLLQDTFWKPRLDLDRTVTIPACLRKCGQTRIPNFQRAAAGLKGGFRGQPYDDSDVYKVLEGAAYCLASERDPGLEAACDRIIEAIAGAQEPDGYLYTARTLEGDRAPGRASKVRWLNEMGGVTGDDSHELYNAGHLYEAAVAYQEATGKRRLLDVAVRNADLVDRTWGPGPDRLHIPPGHPEIELALFKLGRATGQERYLRLAGYLLACRGRYRRPQGVVPAFDDAYYTNSVPLADLQVAGGHAVRTGYLLAGMTDAAALLGDQGLGDAADRVWADTVAAKLYVHGGVGAEAGTEGFGAPYRLPNAGYNETCAAIAFALWNHRLFLLHGDAKYVDVLERTLYNGFLAGLALGGDRFFYPNPLEASGGLERQAWFGTACCPTNSCRFLPSVPGLAFARTEQDIYVNLYAASSTRLQVAGTELGILERTAYPWDGAVAFDLDLPRTAAFTLRLRIPGWARGEACPSGLYRFAGEDPARPALRVNGSPVPLVLEKGYAVLRRSWTRGDRIELDLPMPVRQIEADTRVVNDAGKRVLQRGPLVYCLEGCDHGGTLEGRGLDPADPLAPVTDPKRLGGAVCLRSGQLLAVPYYAWCNRGAGPMAVWVPVVPSKP